MAKQNSKEEQHINVYVRIRPNLEHEHKSHPYLEILSKRELLSKSNFNQRKYVFDRVFDEQSTQQEVYNAVVSPLIPEVISGYNCTVFAYGQTGTGKTYTMEGTHDRDNQISAGIIPRALAQIFKVLSNTNTESSIKVSYLELYNEELFDLLSQSNIPKPIRIFEDKTQKGSVILQGLEELSITELQQVYKILEQGAERRRIASTLMNSSSSRSHTVFTIVVHTRETTIDGEELVKTGKLNLVDLAGSENISKSGAVDKRAREAGNINQSLLTLGRVIKALTERNTHIPYRESKLTRILQDSLGGRTKTSLIATISGSPFNMEETLNTLEYAMRARCIQNRPEVNQKISRTALINQYSDTIEKLQRDLVAMRTGCGFYVDEENYSKLVTDNETQKMKITEKMNYIKKLETDISEYTEKLHSLQTSWVEAANNIEALSNEKKILEHDLILVKEVNEKHIKELHKVKEKHNNLKVEAETLVNDIKIHSLNEDTLHKKVSYLYQTSQTNKNLAKNFYDMYNKLYLELVSRIEGCINFALTSMLSTEALLKEDSRDEIYKNIELQVHDLLQYSNGMRQYTSNYFRNKEVLYTRFDNYFKSIRTLADSIHNRLLQFTDTVDKNLNILHDIINSQQGNLHVIIPVLFSIREAAANEAKGVSDLIGEFRENIIDRIDDIIEQNATLNERVLECHEIIVTLEKKLNDGYDILLNSITNMKRTRSLGFAEYEKNNRGIKNDYSVFSDKLYEFKESTENSIISLQNEARNNQDTLQKSVESTITTFNEVTDRMQLNTEGITKSLNECLTATSNVKNGIGNCMEEYKTALLDYESKVRNVEASDDDQYTTLNKMVDTMSDATKNMQTTVHGIIDKQLQMRNKVEHTTKETSANLKDTLAYCSSCSQELLHRLDEFCGCKLQYPTHAGDTPQKVQPKSSLYVATLTKNCLNTGRYVQFVEEAEKENLSNALNVMYTEDNNLDT